MPAQGQRVGEYVLDTLIGQGAFGQVWRAHHHVWTDRLVAVKIPTNPDYIRQLQREGAAIHGLTHPNIVRALGFDPFAEIPYLTMEYVPGTSLRPLVKERKLSIDDTVNIMRQVLAGVQHAHLHGIIHRDLKPENVLIHESAASHGYKVQGLVKVTDFGLGKARQQTAGSIALSVSLNDEDARELAGTLDYMAPEQRAGQDIDGRADLYACGVMLYEMLTGEKPAGTDVPSDVVKSVPKHLDEAFKRSYARRDRRFASAEEFATALSPQSPPPLPTRVGAVVCPDCGGTVSSSDQFCMYCGKQLVSTVRRCPRCGSFPDPADQFCIFCGEQVAGIGSRQ